MARHCSNEGWELFRALESGGYTLCGHGLSRFNTTREFYAGTNVEGMLVRYSPSTVVLQDRREWLGVTSGPGFDKRERFTKVHLLRERDDILKVSVVKDAQRDAALHRESATEAGIHGWLCYYHPRIVSHLSPFLRPQHLIRMWHTIDPALAPIFSSRERRGCVVSGAVCRVYPLRHKIVRWSSTFPDMTVLPHPGYGRKKCHTPEFLHTLSKFKVSICTASIFGYSLRKLIESTAAGCVVISDLPEDDVLSGIDANIWRVHPSIPIPSLVSIVKEAIASYDPERQEEFARRAIARYSFQVEGKRLDSSIEAFRTCYNQTPSRDPVSV